MGRKWMNGWQGHLNRAIARPMKEPEVSKAISSALGPFTTHREKHYRPFLHILPPNIRVPFKSRLEVRGTINSNMLDGRRIVRTYSSQEKKSPNSGSNTQCPTNSPNKGGRIIDKINNIFNKIREYWKLVIAICLSLGLGTLLEIYKHLFQLFQTIYNYYCDREPISNIARQADHFRERKNEVNIIEKMLKDQDTPLKMIAITGVSGSGKTEIAKSYLNDKSSNFGTRVRVLGKRKIFWQFNASNEEQFLQDLERLIKICDRNFKERKKGEPQDQYKNRLKGKLDEILNESQFFFIFDDAKRGEFWKNYQPKLRTHEGILIITTKEERFWGESGKDLSINKGLTEDLAIKLLNGVSNCKNKERVQQLVTILGNLPLAIVVAGTYIRNYNQINRAPDEFGYGAYIEEIKKNLPEFNERQEDFIKGSLKEQTQGAAISLMIKERDTLQSQILYFFGVCGEQASDELLEEYCEFLKPQKKLNDLILHDSLISSDATGKYKYVNFITQQQAKKALHSDPKRSEKTKIISDFLIKMYQKSYKNYDSDHRLVYLITPHIDRFIENEKGETYEENDSIIADLLFNVAQLKSHLGDHHCAAEYFKIAEKLYEKLGDTVKNFRASFGKATAILYQEIDKDESRDNKQLNDIIEIFVDSLNKIEKIAESVKENRSDFISKGKGSIHNALGMAYNLIHNREEAELHYKEAIEIRECNLNPSDSKANARLELATSLNNIGNLYLEWGKLDQALDGICRSFKLRINSYSNLQSDIAVSLESAGDYWSKAKDSSCAQECYYEATQVFDRATYEGNKESERVKGKMQKHANQINLNINDKSINIKDLNTKDFEQHSYCYQSLYKKYENTFPRQQIRTFNSEQEAEEKSRDIRKNCLSSML